jgi:DNA replication protein DnaC
MIDSLMRYAAAFTGQFAGISVLLKGSKGTGKSSAACALLSEVARVHVLPVKFLRQADIGHAIRSAIRDGSEGDFIHALRQVPLLCVDELGVGKNTDSEVMAVSDLICARHDDGKSTVVTTNLGSEEITTLFGERLGDRMGDRKAWYSMIFDWPSYRA